MKKLLFTIGDIHGEYDLLEEVLKAYDPKLHQLVLVGDLNDRGPKVKESLLKGKELVEQEQAVYIRGNHEQMLLNFVQNPQERFVNYMRNGGKETIESLMYKGIFSEHSPKEVAQLLKEKWADLLKFLDERPFYYEWNQYICVHAGVDFEKSDWHDTDNQDFIWIREPFHTGKNNTGKKIVFGHTVTSLLHQDEEDYSIWHSDGKFGIDGGGVFGGIIHGAIFNDEGIVKDIQAKNPREGWHSPSEKEIEALQNNQ